MMYFHYNISWGKSCFHVNVQDGNNLVIRYCFVDTDECSSDPCMNGGTCTDGVNSYSCACVAGYTGEDCEIGMCYITKLLFTLHVLGCNMFLMDKKYIIISDSNYCIYSQSKLPRRSLKFVTHIEHTATEY